mmetsp:Transcript_43678/g.120922  ORF Transcript_43678/g.120922 Transcript_43678/m.120922 type:complete len:214 (+) Transcript_43678:257-898(+)
MPPTGEPCAIAVMVSSSVPRSLVDVGRHEVHLHLLLRGLAYRIRTVALGPLYRRVDHLGSTATASNVDGHVLRIAELLVHGYTQLRKRRFPPGLEGDVVCEQHAAENAGDDAADVEVSLHEEEAGGPVKPKDRAVPTHGQHVAQDEPAVVLGVAIAINILRQHRQALEVIGEDPKHLKREAMILVGVAPEDQRQYRRRHDEHTDRQGVHDVPW